MAEASEETGVTDPGGSGGGERTAALDGAAGEPPRAGALQALRSDAPSALLALILLIIPLYRTRILEDSFNTPKLAFAMVMGVFTAIGLLARPQSHRMKMRWYPVPWLIVGLAVVQAVSVLWADSKPLGVDGTVYFATFAVLAWLFYRGPRSLAALRGLFHFGAAGAVATAMWVLYDDITRGGGVLVARLPDWRGYLAAGLGNSGHIAGMVGMFLPWVLICLLRGRGAARWLLLPVLAVMFAALVVTWSVGSSGATIIGLAAWAAVAWKVFSRGAIQWSRLGAVIGVGLLVCGLYFTPNPLNPHKPSLWSEAFSSDRWEAGWPTRLVIWKTSWQIIEQNPILGAGTGNFTYAYTQQVVPGVINDPVLRTYAGAFTNDAHNDYLQLWAEGGVVALALWMAVLSTFFVTVVQMLRRLRSDEERALLIAAGAGLTIFALDGLMSFPMRLPAHFTMAVFFLSVPGVIMRLQGVPIMRQGPAAAISHRRLRTGGIGILLTLAACTWHHGHRVVAEYYLKAGRAVADHLAVGAIDGPVIPVWQTCDSLYQQALRAIAAGSTKDVWQPMVSEMTRLADNLDEAQVLFSKSLAADRWYANASSRLGQLLLFKGEFAESLKVSSRTLKTLEAYEIHERMGAAAFFNGDRKLAAEHWRICRERRPDMAEFYTALISQAQTP